MRTAKIALAVLVIFGLCGYDFDGKIVYAESYASNPIPADGEVIDGALMGDDIYTTLDFTAGDGAVSHEAFFSDNISVVVNREASASLGAPPYLPTPRYYVGLYVVEPYTDSLVRGVTYYWCVDETDDLGTTYPGDVWEFTIQDYKACCPNPPDGATVSGPDVLLSWVPGYNVTEHDVYFGTDFDDVNDAPLGPWPYVPDTPTEYIGTVEEPNILVTGLSGNTTYYWRVDEVSHRYPPPLGGGMYYKGYVWCFTTGIPVCQTYHVDGVNGDNTNDGLTKETPFKTIQRGIDVADDDDTVLVWPGVYYEEISFWGDAITVKSAADAAVLETNHGYAFSFFSAEEPNTVLRNFVIRNSQYGIYLINGASPTLTNLTIVDNDFGISAFNGADPDISNCIFWNNFYGDLFRDPVPLEAKYSWIEDKIEADLVSHWKFDEGSGTIAYDSAGNNDGTIYGAAWKTGQVGGALEFDGVNDYVDIPYNSSLDINASKGITLLVWFKLDSYPDGFDQGPIFGLFDSDGDGSKNYLLIDKPLYENLITWDQYPPSYGWIKSIKPDLDTWYHIAVVEDPTYRAIYINGSLDISDNSSESYQGNTPDTIRIGNRADSIPFYFDGIIDEVAIYDRALLAEEIEAIYEAGLAGGGPGFVDANGGDYHLLSERGRYWPEHDVWVLDNVTSPCIDGGDPAVDPSNERMPNGGRINMGAYGNSAYASMSECWSKADLNCDGAVDFKDFAIISIRRPGLNRKSDPPRSTGRINDR